ncbi:hypothetical protein [Mangrovicella endophytica]|uniref:hypothetical protein n=1 Tax=Mangrovicella endophytica TaxID=2066697 RepID=UPI00130015D2|nr:hypothetical protein [Mangrovicella endophytica]
MMNTFLDRLSTSQHNSEGGAATPPSSRRRFQPIGTVRCEGRPVFRTQLARDLGVLLDLDDEVENWCCLPGSFEFLGSDGQVISRTPDFRVHHHDGSAILMDAGGPAGIRPIDPALAYSSVSSDEVRAEPALTNAREMLRYSRRVVSLADRVRLLAWLEEVGSVTLIEAASAMRESTEPVGAVLALVLKRHVTLDWREMPVGPDTQIRPRR